MSKVVAASFDSNQRLEYEDTSIVLDYNDVQIPVNNKFNVWIWESMIKSSDFRNTKNMQNT